MPLFLLPVAYLGTSTLHAYTGQYLIEFIDTFLSIVPIYDIGRYISYLVSFDICVLYFITFFLVCLVRFKYCIFFNIPFLSRDTY